MISMCIVPELVALVECNAAVISVMLHVYWSHARQKQLMQPLQQLVQTLCFT